MDDRVVCTSCGRWYGDFEPRCPTCAGDLDLIEQNLADDALDLWAQAVATLEAHVAESTFKLWVLPLRPVMVWQDRVLVLVGPENVAAWTARRYSWAIEEAAGIAVAIRPYRSVAEYLRQQQVAA
jgi:uncharacterized protein YbaR (Trm112 family)